MSDFIIGLTGGIASGKSAVTDRFVARGVTVADADVAARAIVEPGQPALAEIVAEFGRAILQPDGRLDRGALRVKVFDDDDARRRLEAILHPRIRVVLHDACKAAAGPYAVVAIPLLVEGGARAAYPWLDRILLVDVSRDVQRARLVQRDGVDAALAERMIDAQASRRERLAIADDVIVNDGPLERLDAHVAALDARYRSLAIGAAS
jgi:dephospho-CoA kinase